jgi:DNA-binding NarL/FixJ family response regulator
MLDALQSSDLKSALDCVGAIAEATVSRYGPGFSDRDKQCVQAIRRHLENLYVLDQQLAAARAAWGAPAAGRRAGEAAVLTCRERQVLQWLGNGKSDRDIALILAISPRTVHKHLQRIYEKLGVECRTAAVVRAMAMAPA